MLSLLLATALAADISLPCALAPGQADVTLVRTRMDGTRAGLSEGVAATTPVQLEVLAEDDGSPFVRWTYGRTVVDDAHLSPSMAANIGAALSSHDGLVVEVDPSDPPVVRNREAVATHLARVLGHVSDSAPVTPEAEGMVKVLLQQPGLIEMTALRDVKPFLSATCRLVPIDGERAESRTLPGPAGQGELDATVRWSATAPVSGRIDVSWTVTPDPAALQRLALGLVGLATPPGDQAAASRDLSQASVATDEQGTATIDLVTGWPRQVTVAHRVSVDGPGVRHRSVDTWSFTVAE